MSVVESRQSSSKSNTKANFSVQNSIEFSKKLKYLYTYSLYDFIFAFLKSFFSFYFGGNKKKTKPMRFAYYLGLRLAPLFQRGFNIQWSGLKSLLRFCSSKGLPIGTPRKGIKRVNYKTLKRLKIRKKTLPPALTSDTPTLEIHFYRKRGRFKILLKSSSEKKIYFNDEEISEEDFNQTFKNLNEYRNAQKLKR